MNQCSKIQSKSARSSYADSHNRRDKATIQKHLAECADCRQADEQDQRILELLRGMPAPTLPSSFDAGLHAKLATGRVPREQASPVKRMLGAMNSLGSLPPRRSSVAARFGASLAAAAVVAGGVLLLPLHFGAGSSHPNSPTGNLRVVPGAITPLPTTLSQGDAAFMAACSSQQAQYASTQPDGDPSASTLAASLDETRTAPGAQNNGDDTNRAFD